MIKNQFVTYVILICELIITLSHQFKLKHVNLMNVIIGDIRVVTLFNNKILCFFQDLSKEYLQFIKQH